MTSTDLESDTGVKAVPPCQPTTQHPPLAQIAATQTPMEPAENIFHASSAETTTFLLPSFESAVVASLSENGPSTARDQSCMKNVLIFGETGIGKSSVINMIAGREVAQTSSGALGCTFGNEHYDVNVDGIDIKIRDTAGLNEGEHGSIPSPQALSNLAGLMRQLADGVDLLIYCIRGTRYRDILRTNYEIFVKGICQDKIPVVVVVTGLEHQEPMDSWWNENEADFTRRGMVFDGHACVTTTRGKLLKSGEHMFAEEFAQSTEVVRKLVLTGLTVSRKNPGTSLDAKEADVTKPRNNGRDDAIVTRFVSYLFNLLRLLRQSLETQNHGGFGSAQNAHVGAQTPGFHQVLPNSLGDTSR